MSVVWKFKNVSVYEIFWLLYIIVISLTLAETVWKYCQCKLINTLMFHCFRQYYWWMTVSGNQNRGIYVSGNRFSGYLVSVEPQYINTLMYLLYGTCAQSRGFRQYFWWMTSLKLTFLNKRTWKLHKDCQDKIWILQQHWLQQEDFTLGLDISRLHYVKTGYGVSISGNTKLAKNLNKVRLF